MFRWLPESIESLASAPTVWSTTCICVSFIRPPCTVMPEKSSFELTEIRRRQLNIQCAQVLVQAIQFARTWDWNNPRLLRQEPCKGNLRRCCVLPFCEPLHRIDDWPVCIQVFRAEARESGSIVRLGVGVQPSAAIHFPGQFSY